MDLAREFQEAAGGVSPRRLSAAGTGQAMARLQAPPPTRVADADAGLDIPLCYGDFPYRLQRALGLIPAQGLGVGRRALVAVLVTWVPMAVAAAVAGRFLPGAAGEPLLQHFGVNARFLVAVPLLIIGEVLLERLTDKRIPHFVASGLVPEADRPHFAGIVERVVAWHDTWKPWLVIAALIATWTLIPGARNTHDLLWAADEPPRRLALQFGAGWYIFVARPIFIALALVWLWRFTVLAVLLGLISRLRLSLVPIHPDRAGGLGFLGELPHAFSPLSFALAAVIAAEWGHSAVYHGAPLKSFALPLATFAIVTTAVLIAPLLAFSGSLVASRRRALLDYGALVGEHGRLVHRRWLLGETLGDDSLLTAPELGPAVDTAALYEAVERTRAVPFDLRAFVLIIAPILVPMVPLIAVEIPLVDALKVVLSTLR